MKKTSTLAVALALTVTIPAVAAAQEDGTFLSFTSQPGDYVGAGQSLLFTPDNASFQSSATQNNNHVGGSVFPFAGSFWFFDMAAPDGQPLLPGVYEQATRWPFQAAGQPGLSFFGDGRGCNTLTGRFEVLEALYGPFGYVQRFHATFEQHCEGAAPALFGEVFIVNPPPPPPLSLEVTLNGRGAADSFGVATLIGTATCSIPTTLNLFGVLRQRANRFSLASGTFSASVNCRATPTQWSVQVPPGGSVPFGPGMANADITASGFDSNYGTFVTTQVNAVVHLSRSNK